MIFMRGHYRATGVILTLPQKDAAAMLTSNCELAPQPLTPDGTRPVVLLMGAHDGVRVCCLPISLSYNEALVAVPWLRHRGKPCGTAPLAHVSRLWLNRILPVVGGWLFGFPKRWCRVTMTPESFTVTTFGGHPLLEATFTDHGSAGPPSQFPNFAAVRPVFEQAFIQRLALIGPTCIETMDFHIPRATLQPISARIRIHPDLIPGLSPGTYDFDPIDVVPLGAFRLDLKWTLTAPASCGSVP